MLTRTQLAACVALLLAGLVCAGCPEADWAPDGNRIAFIFQSDAEEPYSLWVFAKAENRLALQCRSAHHLGSPAWSPDGKSIALVETRVPGEEDKERAGALRLHRRWPETGKQELVAEHPLPPKPNRGKEEGGWVTVD